MAAISVFRSQSFLQTVSSSIEREATQKRISAQAGLRFARFNICHPFKLCHSLNIQKTLISNF